MVFTARVGRRFIEYSSSNPKSQYVIYRGPPINGLCTDHRYMVLSTTDRSVLLDTEHVNYIPERKCNKKRNKKRYEGDEESTPMKPQWGRGPVCWTSD